MKKLVSLLLVLAMVLAAVPAVFAVGSGTESDPQVLEMGENKFSIPECEDDGTGSQIYWLTWTASADGILSLNFATTVESGAAAEYYNETTGSTKYSYGGDKELEVAEGDVLTISVSANFVSDGDGWSGWYPAADFTLTASFEEADPVGTKSNPAELVLGKNTFTTKEGDSDGYYLTYVASQDGKLSVAVEAGNPVICANLRNMTNFAFAEVYASGETMSLDVAAGDVIRVNAYVPGSPACDFTMDASFEPAETEPAPTDPEVTEPTDPEPTDPEPTNPGEPGLPAFEDAEPVTIPGEIVAELAEGSDGNWYSWVYPYDGMVYFTVTQAAENVDTIVHIYNLTPNEDETLIKAPLHQEIAAGAAPIFQYSGVGGDQILIYVENVGDANGDKAADTLKIDGFFQRGQIDVDDGDTHTVQAGYHQAFASWSMVGQHVTITGTGSDYYVKFGRDTLYPDENNSVEFDGYRVSEVGGAKHFIYNEGDTDITFTWAVSPIELANKGAGSSESEPKAIEVPNRYTAVLPGEANADGIYGYFFSWTAPEDGTLKLDIASMFQAAVYNFTQYHIINKTTNETWESKEYGLYGMAHESYKVNAGDELIIYVESHGGYESGYTKDSVMIDFSFISLAGSDAEHPIVVTVNEPGDKFTTPEIPAGGSVFYEVNKSTGMYYMYNGANVSAVLDGKTTYEPDAEGNVQFIANEDPRDKGYVAHLEFKNTGSKPASVEFTVGFPEGHSMNPHQLVIGENTGKTIAGDTYGYCFSYIPEADGKLSLNITAIDGIGTAGCDLMINYAPSGKTAEIDVKKGQEVTFELLAYGGDYDTVVSASFTLDASFDCAHAEVEVVDAKEATCTEEGYTGDEICTYCGEPVKQGEVIAKLPHSFGEWEVVKDATCTEVGSEERKCSCGETESKEIPMIPHAYGEWEVVKDATCTEVGSEERKCSCGETETKEIPMIPHAYGEWVVVDEPTCTEAGSKKHQCSCGASETQEIPAVGHNTEIQNYADATCTLAGYTGDEVCTECGEIVKNGEAIPAKGHNFCAWIGVKAPTCTEAGQQNRVCEDCGVVETQEVPALGHNVELKNQKDATCGESGYTGDEVCTVCGKIVVVGEPIPATGKHVWDKGEVVKEPTTEEEGEKVYTCTECGETKSEVLPVKPENPKTGDMGVAPFVILMLISAGALVVLTVDQKKRLCK